MKTAFRTKNCITPLELLNLYYSDGASFGNTTETLWQRVNNLLTWDNMINRNFQADLAPFLYYIIKKALYRVPETSLNCNDIENIVPENVLSWLKISYKVSLFRNMILLNELKRVTESLGENGIKVIPLKGGYLAENVYEDIACRPMGDLDLLVQDFDQENTFRLLSSLGYRMVQDRPSNRELHETFMQKIAGQKVIIEVHNRLVKNKFRKRFDLDKLFKLGYVPFDFRLVYYCWHTVRHGVMRFIWLCDLAELLRQHDTSIDWEHLLKTAVEYNVKQEAIFIFSMASSLLAPPLLKNSPMEMGRFRRFILDKIFLNGKGDLFGANETRQRFIMSLALMKPMDAMMLLPNYIARVTFENRRNLPPIEPVQGNLK